MSISVDQIKLLRELLKIEKDNNKILLEQLEVEKISAEIERDFHALEIQKYKNIANEISKEFLEYIEQHATATSDSDSDSDDDSDIDLDSFFD